MSEPVLRPIDPPDWKRPSGYANGMLAPGTRTLYVAGQVAWDPQERIVSADFAAQFRQALANVLTVVRAAGGGPTNVARLTCFVTSTAEYAAARKAIGAAWRELMGRHFPAMTLVQVAALLEPGAKVEIEGTAVL